MKKKPIIVVATMFFVAVASAWAEDAKLPSSASQEVASLDLSQCKGGPAYPIESARNEETGTVVLQFLISTSGKVLEAKVERSTGFRRLDMAAVEFLARCNKFKPGIVAGRPVESWARVSYEWKIE